MWAKHVFWKKCKKAFCPQLLWRGLPKSWKKVCFWRLFCPDMTKSNFYEKTLLPTITIREHLKKRPEILFHACKWRKSNFSKIIKFHEISDFSYSEKFPYSEKKTYRVTPIKSQNLDPFFRLLQWGNVKKDVFFIFWSFPVCFWEKKSKNRFFMNFWNFQDFQDS